MQSGLKSDTLYGQLSYKVRWVSTRRDFKGSNYIYKMIIWEGSLLLAMIRPTLLSTQSCVTRHTKVNSLNKSLCLSVSELMTVFLQR